MPGGTLQRLRAGPGRIDVVLAHPQVDPQRPEDLRFVVDDENPSHSITVSCWGATWRPDYRAAAGFPAGLYPRRAGSPSSGWPGPGTTGSDRAIVRPPPGASSAPRVPPTAL